MSAVLSPFRVDILDASNAVIGDGPLANVIRLSDVRKLDQTGTLKFEIPAEDERAALIEAGVKFDVYDEVDGYLGRYLYMSKQFSGGRGNAKLQVSAWDQMRELSLEFAAFNRDYQDDPVSDIINALVALVSGWSATIDAGLGSATISYNGESVLKAIDMLRDQIGVHMRLGDTLSELEVGTFGVASGVRAINLRGQVQSEFAGATEIAIIDSIRRTEDIDEIANYIIPLGAGDGVGQLTIQGATAGTYTVQTGTNPDASSYYYLQNAASIAAFGKRVKVLVFNSIRPFANNQTSIDNARNALKVAAETWLSYHLEPRIEYTLVLRALRQTVKVGDTIHIDFRGVIDDYGYIEVNDDFYVLQVDRSRDAETRERLALLTVASVAKMRTTDVDLVAEVISNLQTINIHIRPSPFWLFYEKIDTVANVSGYGSKNAVFKLTIDTKVLQVDECTIRFTTEPLFSWVLQNYGSSISYFRSIQDSHYPAGLTILIDGVDRTVALGGPWQAAPADAQTDEIVDITDYLTGAVGGLWQEHEISFACTTRTGTNIEVPGYTPTTATASQGLVNLQVSLRGITQAVLPT